MFFFISIHPYTTHTWLCGMVRNKALRETYCTYIHNAYALTFAVASQIICCTVCFVLQIGTHPVRTAFVSPFSCECPQLHRSPSSFQGLRSRANINGAGGDQTAGKAGKATRAGAVALNAPAESNLRPGLVHIFTRTAIMHPPQQTNSQNKRGGRLQRKPFGPYTTLSLFLIRRR